MKSRIAFIVLGWTCSSWAAVLQTVQVSGETAAEVSFVTDSALPSMPRMAFDNNTIELTFSGVGLSASLSNQPEISSPHALLQKITYSGSNSGTRVQLVVNGSVDKLRDRARLRKNDGSVSLVLSYPPGSEATFKLLQEEQASLDAKAPDAQKARGGFGWFRLLMTLFVLGGAGVATWYFVRFARQKTGLSGVRRHLIETIAQTPVGGGKASVAVLRVGTEFVLVGITPSQVSLLSSLPKLQSQYEEESSLERGSFQEAIAEEARKPPQKARRTYA